MARSTSQAEASLSIPRAHSGGVRILGTSMALPSKEIVNADLEKLMDTSDEWIVQRTGIEHRFVLDREKGESCWTLSRDALVAALADAGVDASELDLVIVATVSAEMACPSVSCRVAQAVGAVNAGAFDLVAACSGFVYAMNVAHDLIRAGAHRTIGVIGCDTITNYVEYNDAGRGTAILFGDAAAGAVVQATDDASKGVLAQAMHADGAGWPDLYIPRKLADMPEGVDRACFRKDQLVMNGRSVFKFAVSTFPQVIQETLDKAGLSAEDVDHYICHQSNIRILEASRERFGLPEEKLYVNIQRYGNTSAASVPLCLDEVRKSGAIKEGQLVMMVAFGGGLTWASSLWRV